MQLNRQVTVVLGYPGSKKSRLVSKLAKQKEYKVIDTSSLLCLDQLDEGCQNIVKQGGWISDSKVNRLVEEQLQSIKDQKVMIVGYPRNQHQLDHLQKTCSLKQLINIVGSNGQDIRNDMKQQSNKTEQCIDKKMELYQQQQQFVMNQVQSGKVVQVEASEEKICGIQEQKYYFVMGPPCVGKTELCRMVKERTSYEYIDLRGLQKQTNWMNSLIKLLQSHSSQSFIFEGFFKDVKEYELFKEFCGVPQQVFTIDKTKDYVYNLIKIDNKLSQKDVQSIKQNYDSYMDNRQELQQQLKIEKVLRQLQSEKECEEILEYFNPKLYLTLDIKHIRVNEFCLELFNKHNIISLDLSRYGSIDELKRIIYMNRSNRNYLLINLERSSLKLNDIESNINQISYLLDIGTGCLNLDKYYLQVDYQQKGRTIKLDLNDIDKSLKIFEGHIRKRNKYGLVVGCMGVGKTEISKCLATKLNMKLVDWENLTNQLKEKLGGDDGPLEELPFKEIIKYFQNEFISDCQFIIDGWTFTKEQLEQFIRSVGEPVWIVNLKADATEMGLAYKRKKEMETDTELTEDDQAAIVDNQKAIDNIVQVLELCAANTFNSHLHNIDITSSLQNTISDVQQIFMKRIIAICSNQLSNSIDLLLRNICYIHDLVLIDIADLIRKEVNKGKLSELFTRIEKEHKMRRSGQPVEFTSQYSQQLILDLIQNHLNSLVVSSKDLMVIGFPRQQFQFQPRSEIFPRPIDEIICLQETIGEVLQVVLINDSNTQLTDEYDDQIQHPIEKQEDDKPQQQGDDNELKNDDDEEQKPKYDPSQYSWSIHDGTPKNVCQVFAKLNDLKMDTLLGGGIYENIVCIVEQYVNNHSKRLVQLIS